MDFNFEIQLEVEISELFTSEIGPSVGTLMASDKVIDHLPETKKHLYAMHEAGIRLYPGDMLMIAEAKGGSMEVKHLWLEIFYNQLIFRYDVRVDIDFFDVLFEKVNGKTRVEFQKERAEGAKP
jgi:hypothetical protein